MVGHENTAPHGRLLYPLSEFCRGRERAQSEDKTTTVNGEPGDDDSVRNRRDRVEAVASDECCRRPNAV